MALDAATIRQLYATNAGRRYLDDLAAQGVVLPGVRSGGMTALPPGTELLRPRPVLVGPATQATAPTEGFNVGQGDGGMPRPLFPGDLPMMGMDPTAPAPSMDLSNGMLGMDPTAPKPASDPFEGSILAGMGVGGKSPISTQSSDMGGGLWDRVKGFFEPDEPLTAEEQYDEDVSGAGWAGAAQGAAQAASDYRSSPLQVLTAALGGYGVAKQRAKGDLKKEARETEKFNLEKRGLESDIAKREFEQQQAMDALRRQEEVIADLPEGMQGQARALLAAGAKERFGELIAPKPRDPLTLSEGEIAVDATGQVIAEGRPKAETPITLGEGEVAYDRAGNVLARGAPKSYGPQAPITLSEGEVAYDRAGNVIAEGRPKTLGKELPLIQLQSIRDNLPPGQKRDEVDAQIKKLNDTRGESSGTLYKVRRPDGTAGYATREEVAAHPEWEPLTEESTGTKDERDRQKILQYSKVIGKDGTGFNDLTPDQQSEYRRLINEMSPPKFDPASGFTVYPELSDLYRPPPLSDVAVPSAPGAPPSGTPMVPVGAPPGTPGISGAPVPAITSSPLPSPVPEKLERMPPAAAIQTTSTVANRAKIGQIKVARDVLKNAIKEYKEKVKATGGKLIPGSPEYTALNALRTRVTLSAKDVYELGALTGPDLPLMETMNPSATGLSSIGNEYGRVEAGLQALENDIDTKLKAANLAYGPPGGKGATDFTGMSDAEADAVYDNLPVGSTYVDIDGKTKTKTKQ